MILGAVMPSPPCCLLRRSVPHCALHLTKVAEFGEAGRNVWVMVWWRLWHRCGGELSLVVTKFNST